MGCLADCDCCDNPEPGGFHGCAPSRMSHAEAQRFRDLALKAAMHARLGTCGPERMTKEHMVHLLEMLLIDKHEALIDAREAGGSYPAKLHADLDDLGDILEFVRNLS